MLQAINHRRLPPDGRKWDQVTGAPIENILAPGKRKYNNIKAALFKSSLTFTEHNDDQSGTDTR